MTPLEGYHAALQRLQQIDHLVNWLDGEVAADSDLIMAIMLARCQRLSDMVSEWSAPTTEILQLAPPTVARRLASWAGGCIDWLGAFHDGCAALDVELAHLATSALHEHLVEANHLLDEWGAAIRELPGADDPPSWAGAATSISNVDGARSRLDRAVAPLVEPTVGRPWWASDASRTELALAILAASDELAEELDRAAVHGTLANLGCRPAQPLRRATAALVDALEAESATAIVAAMTDFLRCCRELDAKWRNASRGLDAPVRPRACADEHPALAALRDTAHGGRDLVGVTRLAMVLSPQEPQIAHGLLVTLQKVGAALPSLVEQFELVVPEAVRADLDESLADLHSWAATVRTASTLAPMWLAQGDPLPATRSLRTVTDRLDRLSATVPGIEEVVVTAGRSAIVHSVPELN